jgi:microcompartment protein CcmK/EutM
MYNAAQPLSAPSICRFVHFSDCTNGGQILTSPHRKAHMLIARVVGSAVSTIKDDKLIGLKLLVVREATHTNELVGRPFVAADAVGAGVGELVLIAQGSSARQTAQTKDKPVDAVIMGILDELEVGGELTFRKS